MLDWEGGEEAEVYTKNTSVCIASASRWNNSVTVHMDLLRVLTQDSNRPHFSIAHHLYLCVYVCMFNANSLTLNNPKSKKQYMCLFGAGSKISFKTCLSLPLHAQEPSLVALTFHVFSCKMWCSHSEPLERSNVRELQRRTVLFLGF